MGGAGLAKYDLGVLRREFTPIMLYVAVFGTLGSMTFAFDGGWWGSALGHPAFQQYYGANFNPVTGRNVLAPVQQSCGTALGTAGIMIGCMLQSVIGHKLGRKRMLLLLATIACVGSVIQITSVLGSRDGPTRFWQLVAGKIIVNSSVGIATTVVPPYLAEVSPASIRGFMLTCHNIAEVLGGVLANGTMFGMQGRTDKLPWVLPCALQMVIPVMMFIGSPFLPESPRWLCEVGRVDEAVKSIERLRSGRTDAEAEANELVAALQLQREITGGASWRQLFVGSNIKRTIITVGMTCLQQGMGISMVNNYFVITLISIGVTQPITYAFILSSIQFVVMLSVGLYVPDRFGRRPLLLIGATIMGCALLIVGCISAATNNAPPPILARTYIAMFFVWAAAFASSWGPLAWATMAEVPTTALREKTMGLGAWSGFGVGMTVNFVQPYLNASIGGRSAFLYASVAPFAFFFIYFLLPELKGRSLEEVDLMFNSGISARHLKNWVAPTPERIEQVEKYEEDDKHVELDQLEKGRA